MATGDPARRRSPTSRRRFTGLLAGFFLAAPTFTLAQPPTVVRRIGDLELGKPDTPGTPEFIRRLVESLRALGWVEGQNLHVERRYANANSDALKPLAEELVHGEVELIVTVGTPPTLAAMRATTTIPIVFRGAGDPVLLGLVASLAHPGGNVTGFSLTGPEVTDKFLSLLKELLPGVRRIGILYSSANPYFRAERGQYEKTCRSLNLEPLFVELDLAADIGGAIARLTRQHAQALVLRNDPTVQEHVVQIMDAAMKYGLPTMTEQADIVREAGALASYFCKLAEIDRRVAYYIDRILRGAKPGDLPVEQPTQFDLVINLKTAKALGLTIPQSLLLRADEVIQ